MITWLFSDRGTPKSYRMMEGFGVNTYVWVNEKGKAVYVKYHWQLFLFPPPGSFGGPGIQVWEVLLLIESDPGKIYFFNIT